MVSEPLLSGWLNMSREEGERTGSLRSNRDREWLIFAFVKVVDSRGTAFSYSQHKYMKLLANSKTEHIVVRYVSCCSEVRELL